MTINCSTVVSGNFSASSVDDIRTNCLGCNSCGKDCGFLQKYGNPGQLAQLSVTDFESCAAISFECSQCGLCNAVCPAELDISSFFLQLRSQAFKEGKGSFAEHNRILNYEKRGASKLYSWYSLPENCDTVFFPGCTLPGTRPSVTEKTFQYLQEQIENIGIVLDCCNKASHDLGRMDSFAEKFSEMRRYLLDSGVQKVVVACPSCYKIFSEYGQGLEVKTVYEIMDRNGFRPAMVVDGQVILHDPCQARFAQPVQDATRALILATGLELSDSHYERSTTVCCGEGGSAGCLVAERALSWTDKRVREAGDMKIVTYCAGCVNFLSRKSQSFHLLDLIFDPENSVSGKVKVHKAPFTYLHRLKFKHSLKKKNCGVSRESLFSPVKSNSHLSTLSAFLLSRVKMHITRSLSFLKELQAVSFK